MNYTKPNDNEHNDSPEDWLNTALVFTQALGEILADTEGVVIVPRGDAKNIGYEKVIVSHFEGQVHITECTDDNLEHGDRVMVFRENPN